jgi:GNAT superfamily N-acetyltransferase
MKPEFVIERAEASEQNFIEVFEMLLELHKEGGYALLDRSDSAEDVYAVMQEGMTFVARSAVGQPIGVLGLTEVGFWFNRKVKFLQGRWFYVRPAFRRAQVGVHLLRAARDEGQTRNSLVFVTVTNPDRRPKRTTMSLEAQIAGFVPLGYTIRLN